MEDRGNKDGAKVVGMTPKPKVQNGIPFGKPTEVGNFRIWRTTVAIGKGKIKTSIECINVSGSTGVWLVRIPQTYEMFSMLTIAYQWSKSENEEERSRGIGFIRTALSNMAYVSMVCNGFFHHGVEMVASAYANPSLLQDTEDGKSFRQDAVDTIGRFLEWRKEYEKHVADNEPTEADMKSDQVAEEMLEELNKE